MADSDKTNDRATSLAAACHELANALGAIQGWAEVAQEAGGPSASEALARIRACAQNASVLARRVLHDARQGESTTSERIDLTATVSDVLALLHPLAARAGIAIDAKVAPHLWIAGDRTAVETLVWNLALNAIEASPAGERVGVFAFRHEREIKITIADNGSGIPDALVERVFERYFTTKPSGTGLGLGLARDAAHGLGGTLILQPRPQGTTLVVRLPAAFEPDARTHVPGAPDAASAAATSVVSGVLVERVLVVDDDADMRDMIATALALRGADVTSVSTVAEARRTSAAEAFDVACVDVKLEDGDGAELLDELLGRGQVRVGVVMSGARVSTTVAARAPGAPALVWLPKPFGTSELVAAIRSALALDRPRS